MDAFGNAAVVRLVLYQTNLRGRLQKAHDVLPVDESLARQEMLIDKSMVVMEMAVDDLRQEFHPIRQAGQTPPSICPRCSELPAAWRRCERVRHHNRFQAKEI